MHNTQCDYTSSSSECFHSSGSLDQNLVDTLASILSVIQISTNLHHLPSQFLLLMQCSDPVDTLRPAKAGLSASYNHLPRSCFASTCFLYFGKSSSQIHHKLLDSGSKDVLEEFRKGGSENIRNKGIDKRMLPQYFVFETFKASTHFCLLGCPII